VRVGICYNIEYHEDVHKSPSHYFGQILEQVDLLEELGYDTVWFSEHHSGKYSFGNPCVMAAAAAQRTKRIRIGTGVSLLPLRHPIMLAEEFAMLDVLSGGRLEYGIGRGYLMQEYDWLKIPISESHSRYRETADFIIKAWTEQGPFDFKSEHFDIEGWQCFPSPVQKPIPPIYASAGGSASSLEYAATRGLHMGTALFTPDREGLAGLMAEYRRQLRANGFDPATREVCGITQMYCAADMGDAVRDGDQFATNYYRFFADLDAKAKDSTIPHVFNTIRGVDMDAAGGVFLGNPENLRRRIAHERDTLGLDLLLLEVAQGGAPYDKVMSCLELFGKEVVPTLQAKNHTLNDAPQAAG